MSLFQRALITVSGPAEAGSTMNSVPGTNGRRGVGEHLDGHFPADSVGFADSCHLELHLFLCSGLVSLGVL